jgi:hypothetical protein
MEETCRAHSRSSFSCSGCETAQRIETRLGADRREFGTTAPATEPHVGGPSGLHAGGVGRAVRAKNDKTLSSGADHARWWLVLFTIRNDCVLCIVNCVLRTVYKHCPVSVGRMDTV